MARWALKNKRLVCLLEGLKKSSGHAWGELLHFNASCEKSCFITAGDKGFLIKIIFLPLLLIPLATRKNVNIVILPTGKPCVRVREQLGNQRSSV